MSAELANMTPEQLASTPLMLPPPGVQTNFINPESLAPRGIAASAVILAIMVMILALRLYAKYFLLRKPGWDDVAAFMAGVNVVKQTTQAPC